MFLSTVIIANVLTGLVGVSYMGYSVGAKIGQIFNRKRLGKHSPFNEIVTVRSGSDITIDEWYCQRHKKWNWCGDECNCCAMDEESV